MNSDGIIDANDRTFIGKPLPDYIMGFNLAIEYKDFDFSAYAYAELGKDMVRYYERDQPNVNRLDYYLDRWTGPGTSNEVPRATVGATSNKLFSAATPFRWSKYSTYSPLLPVDPNPWDLCIVLLLAAISK